MMRNIITGMYYYFFINTSVIGPYIKDMSTNKKWTDYFIELFTNKKVKVVGTSINIHTYNDWSFGTLEKIYGHRDVYPHVQSMFFCIDNEYFHYLINKDFFNLDLLLNMNISDVIFNKEIGLSMIAINNGWNINCILPKYKNLDYININENINKSSNNTGGDPYYKGAYFGSTIDKDDVIFFKNNRF